MQLRKLPNDLLIKFEQPKPEPIKSFDGFLSQKTSSHNRVLSQYAILESYSLTPRRNPIRRLSLIDEEWFGTCLKKSSEKVNKLSRKPTIDIPDLWSNRQRREFFDTSRYKDYNSIKISQQINSRKNTKQSQKHSFFTQNTGARSQIKLHNLPEQSPIKLLKKDVKLINERRKKNLKSLTNIINKCDEVARAPARLSLQNQIEIQDQLKITNPKILSKIDIKK